MVHCRRCETVCLGKDNYCHYCGAPLKPEILKMVREAYEERRKKAVHDALTVLAKGECIVPEKLNELMAKLDRVFRHGIEEPPAPDDFINPDELEDADSEEANENNEQ